MKKLLILGSTGSIGAQALEVVREGAGLEVVGLAAGGNHRLLVEQARRHGVKNLAMFDAAAGNRAALELSGATVLSGPGSIKRLIETVDCDLVLNAVVGAAGLEATFATLEKGVDLALANKESLVVGGRLVIDLARRRGVKILPVDSEHSAIFQCMQGQGENRLESIFLTASGGPFLGRSREELAAVTREDALNHPRWQMGNKISIDSATLMNKGLEIIEAHYLFDLPYEQIEVLVHPQSIVHSLVRYDDGSVLAQLGLPSMKLPIAYALNYPQRLPVTMPQLDLAAQRELTFFPPDEEAFPCLRLAQEAGKLGGGAPIALNAANEVAVDAFLNGGIGFLEIAAVVAGTLEALATELPAAPASLEQIVELDNHAREQAQTVIDELMTC